MPISRAEPTTSHATNETAPLDPRFHKFDDRPREFAGVPPGPNGSGSPTDATTDQVDSTPAIAGAHELRHERFQIGDVLGEGGMGVVYRARDTRDGREIALKLMKGTLAGTARRRFEREFRSLATLHHPHCLNVFDYGELDRGPFFTMELFQGRPITSLAGRGVDAVLEPLLQVTLALDYIHNQGIVHRDVKPSNILVRPATRRDGSPGFEAKLMDFGLAKYYGVKSSLSAEAGFVGTVAYCAPEQLNNDELDHRADLYCLGLVSYELLSGRYPFPQARLDGMRALMRAQLNDKPRPLAEVSPDVPGPIADAVMRYLRKEPRRRPDSAALLRNAITAYLGIDDQTAVYAGALGHARPMLSVIGFVCRAEELAALDDVLRACLSPADAEAPESGGEATPSLVVVSGEPGIGKSSVVQEAERIARGHGCQVYEGRCFDGNLAPFQPFVEIIRQLIAELRLQERREAAAPDLDLTGTHVAGLPAESAMRLLSIVSDYSGELLRIAPELRKYLPGDAYRYDELTRDPDYIFRALSAFFIEIATLQPVCLSFEDLQWADKSSLDLLRHLAGALAEARRGGAYGSVGGPRLVIVASARSGYTQLDPLMAPLRERRQVMELRLAALAQGETRELIALRLNCRPEELSDELVSRLHNLCGGNPFFVSETVREWFEKAAITRSDDGWVLATVAGDASDLPQTVRDAMRLRIEGLPAKAQQVLGAAAVIGAVIDIDLLRDVLSDLTETDVLDAIDALLPRRVFRDTGNAGRVEFVHDLLRELPYADLTAARRRSLHRRVGELLEQRRAKGQAVAAAVLADHFRSAADQSKGLAYTVEAAEAALEAYAFNNAIGQLTEAQKLLPEHADAATRYNLWKMMGRACGCAGRLDDAISAYTQALAHAEDPIARATAEVGIGENHHRKGLFDEALRHLDIALKEVGYQRPTSLVGRMLGTWRNALFVHCLPRRLAQWYKGPDSERGLDIAFAAAYECLQIAPLRSMLTYLHGSYLVGAIAKRSGRTEHVAVAHAKFALNCGGFGLHRLARVYSRAALSEVEMRSHDVTWGRVLAQVGATLYFAGRLDEGETLSRESMQILDKVSDYYTTWTHHWLRHSHMVRGDIGKELIEAEAEILLGTTRGDDEVLAWGLYGKADALARLGRTDEAQALVSRAIELLRGRESLTVVVAGQVAGFVRLQASDYEGASVLLQGMERLLRTNLFFMEFSTPLYPIWAESLVGPHWAKPEGGPTRSTARKAWRVARVARFFGWTFPNIAPHAFRVSGRAAFAMGKAKEAARYFERAIVAAEKHGAKHELARALLDASRVIPDRAEEYRRRGQQLLNELGAVVPEAERMDGDQPQIRESV